MARGGRASFSNTGRIDNEFAGMSSGGTGYGSGNGRVRIGLVAFNKHIAEEMKSRLAPNNVFARRLFEGSSEQARIWDVLMKDSRHVVIEAVAGSGKTTTLMQYVYRLGDRADVECMTYHSLGFKAVRANVQGSVRVDQYKVLSILDDMNLPVESRKLQVAKYKISSMASFAKTYGLSDVTATKEKLEVIMDTHDVDITGFEDLVFAFVPQVLRRCASELSTVDFDDMVWLPYVLGLTVPKYDVLCVDEYQDTGFTQQWLAVRGGRRVVAVGDPRQAIYQFRGASGDGFDKLRAELGTDKVVTLPLTLTRRCPKSHVRLAQVLVPQIQAMNEAPEGVVRVAKTVDAAADEMKPGDLVVCRVNAPLLSVAYKLLKRGVKAVVRGRDIGTGIIKLVDKACMRLITSGDDNKLSRILHYAAEITGEEVTKFLAISHGRGEMRASNAQDRCDCLVELSQDCKDVNELRGAIERLFSDFETDGQPKHAVVLGTVHRTKGLESSKVFVLAPELIPHPMSKGKAGLLAEQNLAYVAVTRSQSELVFVGKMCSLFLGVADDVAGDIVDDGGVEYDADNDGDEHEDSDGAIAEWA